MNLFFSTTRQAVSGLLTTSLLISACNHNDDNPSTDRESIIQLGATHSAVTVTTASDYSSSAHSVITLDEPREIVNNLLARKADFTIASFGEYFYRIERDNDNVTKFHMNQPNKKIWNYPTTDATDTAVANVHDMVFVNETKAYLLRYGSSKIWIVDPSATNKENFKTGEIDLSAYDDGDGTPEVESGVIVDGLLYIIMQRLTKFTPEKTAYVAVFDTLTDTEVDTSPSTDAVPMGLALPVKNPQKIVYSEPTGKIYVQAIGSYTPDYTGGIVEIDPDTYTTNVILDDGDDISHPYGQISNFAIVSPTKAYFVGNSDYFSNTLYSFNPSDSIVPNILPINGVADLQISDITLDATNNLWIANGTDKGITIVNTNNDTLQEALISTGEAPGKIVFCSLKDVTL